MAYRDPEKQRAYQREYMRQYRTLKKKERKKNLYNHKTKKNNNVNTDTGNNPDNCDKTCSPLELYKQEETPFRIQTTRHVLDVIAETIGKVKFLNISDVNEALQQARAIGYLAGIALKAVEIADLEDRIKALEEVLQNRNENNNRWTA